MRNRLALPLAFTFAASLALAACSGGPGATPAPRVDPPASARAGAPATAESTAPHGPGRWFFRQVSSLELRDEQRASIAAIQQRLRASMEPQRDLVHKALLGLADAVEAGQLDGEKASQQKIALFGALAGAKASLAEAVDGVHDTLDPAQRVALVQKLQAEHHAGQAEGDRKQGPTKLALLLGLSEQQKEKITAAVNQGLDELFPDRKARREAWQAKMKAMGEAFVTDDFDAADYDLAEHAGEVITSSVAIASRAIDVSRSVLSAGQRRIAADYLRSRVYED